MPKIMRDTKTLPEIKDLLTRGNKPRWSVDPFCSHERAAKIERIELRKTRGTMHYDRDGSRYSQDYRLEDPIQVVWLEPLPEETAATELEHALIDVRRQADKWEKYLEFEVEHIKKCIETDELHRINSEKLTKARAYDRVAAQVISLLTALEERHGRNHQKIVRELGFHAVKYGAMKWIPRSTSYEDNYSNLYTYEAWAWVIDAIDYAWEHYA